MPDHGSSDTEVTNNYLYHPPPMLKAFLPLVQVNSREGNELAPSFFYPPSFFSFSSFEVRHRRKARSNGTAYPGKLESHYTCLGKGTGSEKPCKDHKFTLQGKLNQNKTKTKTSRPFRKEENLILREHYEIQISIFNKIKSQEI